MILLDTQSVAWLALEPEELSARARAAIQKARSEDGVAISDKTLWELAMMISRNKIEVNTSLREFLISVEGFALVIPVDASIAERGVGFSRKFPKDPADRIIAATAVVHGMPLVTSDKAIRASGEVQCIW